jgi:hypothetical protein
MTLNDQHCKQDKEGGLTGLRRDFPRLPTSRSALPIFCTRR